MELSLFRKEPESTTLVKGKLSKGRIDHFIQFPCGKLEVCTSMQRITVLFLARCYFEAGRSPENQSEEARYLVVLGRCPCVPWELFR